jgi:ribosomal protein S18 acetylase RimI-like enzyme
MAESQSAGRVVRLSVENNNRARTLYERLGFQVCDQSDFYFHMEWNPPAAVTSST